MCINKYIFFISDSFTVKFIPFYKSFFTITIRPFSAIDMLLNRQL